ncbi:SSI family serine proteinase inhibitor [Streptomyces sp. NPDC021100]|uniref:SSI family serine proteinase inhibitor n=1 Tax=Streptomyces sp. NPDC021100 TaxID=3365114 RepID=UPI00379E83FA
MPLHRPRPRPSGRVAARRTGRPAGRPALAAAVLVPLLLPLIGASPAAARPLPVPPGPGAAPATGAPLPGPGAGPVPGLGNAPGNAPGNTLGNAPGSTPGSTPGDHLTVVIVDSGRNDGRYELDCHPAFGTVPDPQGACDQLDGQTRWDRDLFAPVPADAQCTMIYGGPERAHVSGTWAGRPVDTDFTRVNGCEMARWNRFSHLLGEPAHPSEG